MAKFLKLLRTELVTGMVLLAPVAGTIYLFYLLVGTIDSLFPDALRPTVLGRPLPGLGVISVLFLALLVGLFAHNFIGRRLVDLFDRTFSKVPFFGSTYGLIKQVLESVFSQGAESFKRAVLIEYPRPGIYSLAFVTSAEAPIAMDGKQVVSVFLPTTPNPTSGFYLLVDRSLVTEVNISVEQAFKIVITMGVVQRAETLKLATPPSA